MTCTEFNTNNLESHKTIVPILTYTSLIQMEPFYSSLVYPCGYTEVREHLSFMLVDMRNEGLVPSNQDVCQISIYLTGNNDHCQYCEKFKLKGQGGALLKHSYICKHNVERPITDSVLDDLKYSNLVPANQGNVTVVAQCSYCGDCQQQNLDSLLESLNSQIVVHDTTTPADKKALRDQLKAIYSAQLRGQLSPAAYKKLLGLLADFCVHVIPGEELGPWLLEEEEGFSELARGDLKSAVEVARLIVPV
jgi:hypothetical protein